MLEYTWENAYTLNHGKAPQKRNVPTFRVLLPNRAAQNEASSLDQCSVTAQIEQCCPCEPTSTARTLDTEWEKVIAEALSRIPWPENERKEESAVRNGRIYREE